MLLKKYFLKCVLASMPQSTHSRSISSSFVFFGLDSSLLIVHHVMKSNLYRERCIHYFSSNHLFYFNSYFPNFWGSPLFFFFENLGRPCWKVHVECKEWCPFNPEEEGNTSKIWKIWVKVKQVVVCYYSRRENILKLFFLFCLKNIDYVYSFKSPHWAVLTSINDL